MKSFSQEGRKVNFVIIFNGRFILLIRQSQSHDSEYLRTSFTKSKFVSSCLPQITKNIATITTAFQLESTDRIPFRLNEYTNVEEMAPTSPPDQTHGYLWVGEKSPVFGYSWNRCWCRVLDGMFVIQVGVLSCLMSVRLPVC